MANDAKIEQFWKEKEEALGGKILYQTYATFLGEAGSESINGRGGLFYVVGDRIYFEDFEKFNAMMALFNRKDDKYEKTELSMLLVDVLNIQRVSEKYAKACINGNIREDDVPPLSKIKSIFYRGYWKITVKDRPAMFLEIMDDAGLLKLIPLRN